MANVISSISVLLVNLRLLKSLRANLFFLVFLTLFLQIQAFAQTDIPLGSWRMHLSYTTINSVSIGADKVFGASANSIMVFDKEDHSISTYSKINGLSGAGISFINYNEQTDQLLIAYNDGNLDIIQDNTVFNFSGLKDLSGVTGSKKINRISFHLRMAYLSTDYGLVVFDLDKKEVKETWRDLGVNGIRRKIFQSAVLNDSIFLATENGILIGSLTDNLLDYNSWKRFDQGIFNSATYFVATFNGKIYTAFNNSGLYSYQTGVWTKESFLQNVDFNSINASLNSLLISEGINLWRLNPANELTQLVSDVIREPLFASEDNAGKIWVGDKFNGLISNVSGSFFSYMPNGPINATTARLKYHNKIIYSLPGGHTKTFQPLNNSKGYDYFTQGRWYNQSANVYDVNDMDFTSEKTYLASFGYGLEERMGEASVIYNENNSPLANINPPGRFVNVSAIEASQQGLWVANYGAINSLLLLKENSTWQSFDFTAPAARYPEELLTDFSGLVWMALDSIHGGGLIVFDPEKNKTAYLDKQNNAGGLPSSVVRSLALDRDGYVWIGTDLGVAYVTSSYDVFASEFNVSKPIFENRFLLRSEKVTAIAVDGGNRKWMGTDNGVWLFGPSGEDLIYNFTSENSPLPSNQIHDIEINHDTGEVFFATGQGVVSYRAAATESNFQFQSVKIFPNPITSEFNGTVGISGLAADATVKITDISGKLIWQTQANGGTATWNLYDYNGHRAVTGIYLVFASNQDSTENIVGKIAVVE